MMTKKSQKVMKGLGVAMAVGSVVAAAGASMTNPTSNTKKNMKKAMNTVTDFVDTVASMM